MMKALVIRVNVIIKNYQERAKSFCTLMQNEDYDIDLHVTSNYDHLQDAII